MAVAAKPRAVPDHSQRIDPTPGGMRQVEQACGGVSPGTSGGGLVQIAKTEDGRVVVPSTQVMAVQEVVVLVKVVTRHMVSVATPMKIHTVAVVVVRIVCSWTVSQGCQRMASVSQACRCSWTVSQSAVPSCQKMLVVSYIMILRLVGTAAAVMMARKVTVSQPYNYIGQNCHMMKAVDGAVVASRSTTRMYRRVLFNSWQVYPAAEAVVVRQLIVMAVAVMMTGSVTVILLPSLMV